MYASLDRGAMANNCGSVESGYYNDMITGAGPASITNESRYNYDASVIDKEIKTMQYRRETMQYLFIEYPKCSTCQKAKKWLEDNKIQFIDRHIVENNPTEEELTKWIEQSGKPIKKFFNTSGMLYKQMQLKEKLEKMTDEEKIRILSTNGMLVKRPLLIGENIILTGFKVEEWNGIKN